MAAAKSDPHSYVLPIAESQRIFDRDIVPAELGSLGSSKTTDGNIKPVAVFVVGQTGAGKTRTAPAIKVVMQSHRGQPAHFIADTYKTYHPAYPRLVVEAPALASPATGTDARRWLAMAAEHAIGRGIDVLLESACRNPADFADLAQAFHDAGYRVEVAIMAVPEGLSRLGILTRFYERLPEAGSRNLPPRLTPTKVHADSYEGLLDAAVFVDESSAVDQIVVVRRDHAVAYANERVNGSWKRAAATRKSLMEQRDRCLPKELSIARKDIENLRGLAIPELPPQLEEIESLLGPLMDENNNTHAPPLRLLVLPDIGVAGHSYDVNLDLTLGTIADNQ
ncbi:uncharacterized protein JN550_000091 [Neoarthrinium moseri]|uniref:uncharacterized protein n=1 Tax=Neoarthrinium moseri TaxID=1658444 RepID=UPI001FDBD93D|nr:uncharacterized protein JN550_000091 [Neoarthrinium moseri]KAI1877909.1 hypothetical protein JN550_000091 [Neoarthrinium moseri]